MIFLKLKLLGAFHENCVFKDGSASHPPWAFITTLWNRKDKCRCPHVKDAETKTYTEAMSVSKVTQRTKGGVRIRS